MAAGPPRCPCGEHLLAQLKTPEMRATWATREGISWSWYRGVAYFHFCHKCHNTHWRTDVRGAKGNRHTRPRDADPMAGTASRKANGELFYLTAPAPEFLSPVVRQQAKRFRATADTAEAPRASGLPVFGVASVHQPSASTGGLLRPRRAGQRPPQPTQSHLLGWIWVYSATPRFQGRESCSGCPFGQVPSRGQAGVPVPPSGRSLRSGATSNVEHVVSPHKLMLICMAPQTIGDGAHTKTNTYMCDPTGDVRAPHEAVLSAYRHRFF
jgi:hypothetical protein